MEDLLGKFVDEIGTVMGVRTAYLVNNRGELLFPQTERLGRANLTATGALELIQCLGVFELPGDEIAEAEMSFVEGKLIVYNNIRLLVPSKLGVQETIMVLLGDKNLNKAHLRLTLNVALSKVVSDKRYKKLAQPVRIRKTTVLSREKLNEKEFAQAEKIRQLVG
jgi:hypothetical protein